MPAAAGVRNHARVAVQPLPTPTRRAFETLKVGDVMHPGVVSCPPDASLHVVASLMSMHGMHSVFVFEPDRADVLPRHRVRPRPRGRGPGGLATRTAGESAVTPIVTVRTDDALERAAELMVDNSLSHLCVVDAVTRRPVGVLSTIDIARVIATPV